MLDFSSHFRISTLVRRRKYGASLRFPISRQSWSINFIWELYNARNGWREICKRLFFLFGNNSPRCKRNGNFNSTANANV